MAYTWKMFEQKQIQISDYCLRQMQKILFFLHVLAFRIVFSLDVKCWFSTLGSVLCLCEDFNFWLTSTPASRSMLLYRVETNFV